MWVGGISYSLYLWHWPLLVGARELQGGGALTWRVALVVVLVSVIPAWLSTRFVEERFRGGTLPTGRRVLVSLTRLTLAYGVTAGVCGLALAAIPALSPVGSLTTASGEQVRVTPAPDVARGDVYQPFYDGCPELGPRSPVTRCVGGDPDGDLTIAVVGDSHAVMWMNGLDAAGTDLGWRVELMARTSCPAADVVPVGPRGPRTECQGWLAAVHQELAGNPPDIVITAHVTIPRLEVDGEVVPSGRYRDTLMADGLVGTWSELEATGALVVSLTPTPRFRESRVECLGRHPDDLSACDAPVEEVLPRTQGAVDLARQRMPSVPALDLNDLICPGGTCRAVHDNVLVYSDDNHLTRTWVLLQADEMGRRLAALVDEAGVKDAAAAPPRPSTPPVPQADA